MRKLIFFTIMCVVFTLTSCNPEHEHIPGEWEYKNENEHWYFVECIAGECDISPITEAHYDENYDHICDACGYEIKHEHISGEWSYDDNYHWASYIRCTWQECDIDPALNWHVDDNYDKICDVCTHVRESSEYMGLPISSLSYESIDYMGAFNDLYIFDFKNNVLKLSCYNNFDDTVPAPDIIYEFSEEEERALINKLYFRGLFDISEDYPQPPDICDGGGWNLVIEFENGTVKESHGSNNSPIPVFNECAKAFYDLCRRGIVAYVPKIYYTPPRAIEYTYNGYGSFISCTMADYSWNGFKSTDNNIYNINQDNVNTFYKNVKYTLTIGTQNYEHLSGADKFSRYIIKAYDYNEELTNEITVHSGEWFKRLEIELEHNKIYVIRYEYENGDFVEFTFNTKTTS